MKRIYLLVTVCLSLMTTQLPSLAHAGELNQESTAVFGDFTVHYSAFNSTFLQPKIAEAYQLVRAKNQVLLNITVQDKNGEAIDGNIEGYAQNLMQQKKPIDFKTIKEQYAVYSIGSLRITNEEVFNFVINIAPDGVEPFTLKFTRKLYVD
ncbi:MAG TPA: DUF4426 domain-containing protein [Marinagarivorans sp.]